MLLSEPQNFLIYEGLREPQVPTCVASVVALDMLRSVSACPLHNLEVRLTFKTMGGLCGKEDSPGIRDVGVLRFWSECVCARVSVCMRVHTLGGVCRYEQQRESQRKSSLLGWFFLQLSLLHITLKATTSYRLHSSQILDTMSYHRLQRNRTLL